MDAYQPPVAALNQAEQSLNFSPLSFYGRNKPYPELLKKVKQCSYCERNDLETNTFKICSRCHQIGVKKWDPMYRRYCSKECQKDHWRVHRKEHQTYEKRLAGDYLKDHGDGLDETIVSLPFVQNALVSKGTQPSAHRIDDKQLAPSKVKWVSEVSHSARPSKDLVIYLNEIMKDAATGPLRRDENDNAISKTKKKSSRKSGRKAVKKNEQSIDHTPDDMKQKATLLASKDWTAKAMQERPSEKRSVSKDTKLKHDKPLNQKECDAMSNKHVTVVNVNDCPELDEARTYHTDDSSSGPDDEGFMMYIYTEEDGTKSAVVRPRKRKQKRGFNPRVLFERDEFKKGKAKKPENAGPKIKEITEDEIDILAAKCNPNYHTNLNKTDPNASTSGKQPKAPVEQNNKPATSKTTKKHGATSVSETKKAGSSKTDLKSSVGVKKSEKATPKVQSTAPQKPVSVTKATTVPVVSATPANSAASQVTTTSTKSAAKPKPSQGKKAAGKKSEPSAKHMTVAKTSGNQPQNIEANTSSASVRGKKRRGAKSLASREGEATITEVKPSLENKQCLVILKDKLEEFLSKTLKPVNLLPADETEKLLLAKLDQCLGLRAPANALALPSSTSESEVNTSVALASDQSGYRPAISDSSSATANTTTVSSESYYHDSESSKVRKVVEDEDGIVSFVSDEEWADESTDNDGKNDGDSLDAEDPSSHTNDSGSSRKPVFKTDGDVDVYVSDEEEQNEQQKSVSTDNTATDRTSASESGKSTSHDLNEVVSNTVITEPEILNSHKIEQKVPTAGVESGFSQNDATLQPSDIGISSQAHELSKPESKVPVVSEEAQKAVERGENNKSASSNVSRDNIADSSSDGSAGKYTDLSSSKNQSDISLTEDASKGQTTDSGLSQEGVSAMVMGLIALSAGQRNPPGTGNNLVKVLDSVMQGTTVPKAIMPDDVKSGVTLSNLDEESKTTDAAMRSIAQDGMPTSGVSANATKDSTEAEHLAERVSSSSDYTAVTSQSTVTQDSANSSSLCSGEMDACGADGVSPLQVNTDISSSTRSLNCEVFQSDTENHARDEGIQQQKNWSTAEESRRKSSRNVAMTHSNVPRRVDFDSGQDPNDPTVIYSGCQSFVVQRSKEQKDFSYIGLLLSEKPNNVLTQRYLVLRGAAYDGRDIHLGITREFIDEDEKGMPLFDDFIVRRIKEKPKQVGETPQKSASTQPTVSNEEMESEAPIIDAISPAVKTPSGKFKVRNSDKEFGDIFSPEAEAQMSDPPSLDLSKAIDLEANRELLKLVKDESDAEDKKAELVVTRIHRDAMFPYIIEREDGYIQFSKRWKDYYYSDSSE